MAPEIPGFLAFLGTSVTIAAIYSILGMSLNLRFGYTGLFDFGIVLFFLIGSYALVLTAVSPAEADHLALGLPLLLALPTVVLIAAVIAFIIGLPLLRIRAEYFALATLAFGEIARFIFINERWLAGGNLGTAASIRPLSDWLTSSAYAVFYGLVTLLVAGLVYWFTRRLVDSPLGRLFRAIRENDTAVQAIGKDPYKVKMKAWVISAGLAGIAGILWVPNVSIVSPNQFLPIITITVWVGLLFGGRGNMLGAAVGAFVVSFAQSIFQLVPFLNAAPTLIPVVQKILLAILIIVVVFRKPDGIIPEPKHLVHDPQD